MNYIWINGIKEEFSALNLRFYLSNHNIHREDGPAIIYSDGGREWWLNGKEIPIIWIKENIANPAKLTKEEQVLMKLTWG